MRTRNGLCEAMRMRSFAKILLCMRISRISMLPAEKQFSSTRVIAWRFSPKIRPGWEQWVKKDCKYAVMRMEKFLKQGNSQWHGISARIRAACRLFYWMNRASISSSLVLSFSLFAGNTCCIKNDKLYLMMTTVFFWNGRSMSVMFERSLPWSFAGLITRCTCRTLLPI